MTSRNDDVTFELNIAKKIASLYLVTITLVLIIIGFIVYEVFTHYPSTVPSRAVLYVLILALFVFFFALTRTFLEYMTLSLLSRREKQLTVYVEKMLRKMDSGEGSLIAVQGEIRFVIALTIILLLAIALLELITTRAADDFVKSILAVFTGAITSIVSFYFGTKATQEGRTPSPQPKPPLTLTTLTATADPSDVKAGDQFTVNGKLTKKDGSPLAGEIIHIQKKDNGDTWADLPNKIGQTAETGNYSIPNIVFESGKKYRAYYKGSATYAEAFSELDFGGKAG